MQSIWSNIENFPLEIQLITEEMIGYTHNSGPALRIGHYVGLSDIIVYFETKKLLHFTFCSCCIFLFPQNHKDQSFFAFPDPQHLVAVS